MYHIVYFTFELGFNVLYDLIQFSILQTNGNITIDKLRLLEQMAIEKRKAGTWNDDDTVGTVLLCICIRGSRCGL